MAVPAMAETPDLPREQGAPVQLPDRFTSGALIATLLVALLACATGAAIVSRQPPSTQAPTHHAKGKPRQALAAPTPAVPNGSHIPGTITAVDQQFNTLRVRVGDQQYLYHMDYRTLFPQPCLTRSSLRPGQTVMLNLPWYAGGDVYVQALTPLHGCGAAEAPRAMLGNTDDSPPSAHAGT